MRKFIDAVGEFIIIIALSLLLYVGIRHFVGFQFTVKGDSMLPTTVNNQHLVVNRMGDIKRFDIVVLDAPDKSGDKYIKRVIGMPGDTVEYKNNQLYINGKSEEEPYLKTLKDKNPGKKVTQDFSLKDIIGQEKVPEGEYFVLGDNRPVSKDGRYFGTVKKDLLYGNVHWRIWPLSEFGRVN